LVFPEEIMGLRENLYMSRAVFEKYLHSSSKALSSCFRSMEGAETAA
jgi:DNA-binding transcriptional regulator YiaG